MDGTSWDRWAWMDALDPKLVERYPLQIANCERIDHNDAVYIFDEVGIGKTITAGLMALHYLFQHYEDMTKKVLVITTPALARGGGQGKPLCQRGMYLSDWSKLPFEELRLSHRIDIINNNYANLKNLNDYSFVIIDEAHTFLTLGTQCRSNLIGCYCRPDGSAKASRTEKVAFLTATPIKTSFCDLQDYRCLAQYMLCREWKEMYAQNQEGVQNDPGSSGEWADAWIDRLTREQEHGAPICAKFDTREPVTRYFKEIVERTAQFSQREAKALPLRHEPELWKYGDGITRQEALLRGLKDARAEDRFIIFVKYVKGRSDSARELKRFLQRNGFSEDDVAVVTGQYCSETVEPEPGTKGGRPEHSALSLYTGENPKRRPKVLIMTYQIGEAGVNLPTFHYVVNYQIPSYPSALEQRFGRIDRMTKNPHEIHACYLVSEEIDTNTVNFCQAVRTYLGGLLPYLPAKNALVSPMILGFCVSKEELCRHFIQELTQVSKKPGAFEAYQEHQKDPEAEIDPPFYELIELCDEHMGCPAFSQRGQFRKAVKQMLENLKIDEISPELNQKTFELLAPSGGQSGEEQNAILYAVNMEDIKENGILSAKIERVTAKECADEIMNGKGKDAYREFYEKTVGRHRADEASRARVIQSCAAKISECLDGLVKEETELETAFCGASTQEAKDAFYRENRQRIWETIDRHRLLAETDDVHVLCYLGFFYSGDLWTEWTYAAGNDAEECFVKAAVSWAKSSAERGELSAVEGLGSGVDPQNCTWVIESFLAQLGKYKFPNQLEQTAAYRLKFKLAKLYKDDEKAFQQYMELIRDYRGEAKKDYLGRTKRNDNPFTKIVSYFKRGVGTNEDRIRVDSIRTSWPVNIGKMRLGNARSR